MSDRRNYVNFELIRCLRLVKFLYDIGIYDKAVGKISEIGEDDYYELALLGLEHVAPVFDLEELGDDVCCGGHALYSFSDPAIPEYYRLCRLYEYKHGIAPEENPYVKDADNHLSGCVQYVSSDFGLYYNDDVHIRDIRIEVCPERPVDERELIELVYATLEYYRCGVETLRAELLSGPVVWLPALPERIKQPKDVRTRKKAEKPLKKAG